MVESEATFSASITKLGKLIQSNPNIQLENALVRERRHSRETRTEKTV